MADLLETVRTVKEITDHIDKVQKELGLSKPDTILYLIRKFGTELDEELDT